MNGLDWAIMVVYLATLIWLSYRIGRTQKDEEDYYLGGKRVHWIPVGISTMATQLSTNSMLGAPAFVAFSLGGGLLWLQYELAVPLAMIFIMIFLVPFFKKSGVISIYEYLELRLGPVTRVLLSVLFQFIVAFGTGVTVYGISIVLQVCLGIPFWLAVLLLGVVTVIYDTLGGIRSVILSDVLQMLILVIGIAVAGYYAVSLSGGFSGVLAHFDPERLKALDISGHGLGDGATFAFWPMLVGGFFLYVAYYGCNQTQVQRHLSTAHIDDTNMALVMNGILRFPVVVGYCLLGVAIGAFAVLKPEFLSMLPTREVLNNGVVEQVPNFNAAVPMFVLRYLPHGIIGVIIVALFAAAMSSLDSTLNSLSATTMRDIVERFFGKAVSGNPGKALLWSKGITVFWGVACVTFSFFVGNISDSIIVSINKIGSLANGPILATFLLAILTRRANDWGTVIGIVAGFLVNLYLWLYVPGVSWLWWNVIGCGVTFGVGYAVSLAFAAPSSEKIANLVWRRGIGEEYFRYGKNWKIYYGVLILWFLIILVTVWVV
ncbi:MAG: sodium:proline symporter [Calditrichaeota bacterium]|nr:MAG: sodium:proline symporter [Calditrichota bacterium]